MTLSQETIRKELDILDRNIDLKKIAIERAMDGIGEGVKKRDEDRKKIMLGEIKNMLRVLGEVDKKVVRDVKAESFDTLMQIMKLKEEISECARAADEPGASAEELERRAAAVRARAEALPEVPRLEVARAPGRVDQLGALLASGECSAVQQTLPG